MSKLPPKKKHTQTKQSAFAISPKSIFPWLHKRGSTNTSTNVISPKENTFTKPETHRLFHPIITAKPDVEIIDLTSEPDEDLEIIDLTGPEYDEPVVVRSLKPIEEMIVSLKNARKVRQASHQLISDDNLHGTPVYMIKNQYPMFYSYDPRGVPKTDKLPQGYCRSCRCPLNYCSETILGPMVTKRCDYEIYKRVGIQAFDDGWDIEQVYRKAYTDAVHGKMMWNNIYFPMSYDTLFQLYVPNCMRRGSLSEVKEEFSKEKERQLALEGDDEEPTVDEKEQWVVSNNIWI